MANSIELIGERLKELKKEITPQDRKDAGVELNLSAPTLHKYLSGNVPDADLGIRIYEFFIGKIRERIERLKAIA